MSDWTEVDHGLWMRGDADGLHAVVSGREWCAYRGSVCIGEGVADDARAAADEALERAEVGHVE
jgi:hypothetical protein